MNNSIKIISIGVFVVGLAGVGISSHQSAATAITGGEVPACNADVVKEVVLRDAVAAKVDKLKNINSIFEGGGAFKEKIRALANSWEPHFEAIVQTSYDSVNGFRYCEAEAVEKAPPQQPPAELASLVQELPKETQQTILAKLINYGLVSALSTRKFLSRRVSYKIGLTQDNPSQVYVWWQCDE